MGKTIPTVPTNMIEQIFAGPWLERAKQLSVSQTQYGWRVEFDPQFDRLEFWRDKRPSAYWPKQVGARWVCKCWWPKGSGACPHVLAVWLEIDRFCNPLMANCPLGTGVISAPQ